MLPSVYIETTIPSYLAAWPSSDLVRAAHQKITKDWWLIQKEKFDILYPSLSGTKLLPGMLLPQMIGLPSCRKFLFSR